ncbi:MAG: ATP-binding protein [Flavobacteriales bacterium]|nr:ATP-binding protein [Flavobacteriales bacterium]
MKLSKFDIGAEIISIITKGMYPDPKDALREYIQNGVDAHAKKMSVKVRQESIVVEDDGIGMDFDTLRKAIRIGISDKSPTKNVGFMGIGIYSSFHLCDKLTIFSRGSKDIPNKLEMDFGKMKLILEKQKDKRLKGEIQSEELIDLQTILEDCISLSNDGELDKNSFPAKGTRVELSKIEPEFYTALSNFDEVSDYLRNVIPLKFNEKEFKYAKQIEDEISRICSEKNQKFELVSLTLQVNSKIEELYRPYRNMDFSKDSIPLEPIFHNIESGDVFFGVAWGCLNSQRKKLDNKNLRGFILKKQGFSIGNRESLIKFFPRGNTFFDRYSGEVIIVNPKLLPNASRNDIEYSPLRSVFYESLTMVADKFDDEGHKYQEISKADEDLANLHTNVKEQLGSYNEFEEDTEVLVGRIVILKNIYDRLNNRIQRKGFSEESEIKAKALLEQVSQFENTIQQRIKLLTDSKKKKQEEAFSSKNDLAKNVAKIKVDKVISSKNYESLFELLNDLEFKIDEEFKEAIFSIDELFVQRAAKTKAEYYELLNILKERIQNND